MRWLTRSALLSLALGWAQQVSASCNGGPSNTDIADSNAATLFVISQNVLGDFSSFGGFYPASLGGGAAVTGTGTTVGVTAADQICTYYATSPTNNNPALSTQTDSSIPYFNQNHAGGTVQFVALLSTSTIDAVTRLSGISSLNIVDSSADRLCLASSVSDLFGGHWSYSTSQILSEDGNAIASNLVYTGTGTTAAQTALINGGRYHTVGSATVDPLTGFCNDGKGGGDWRGTGGATAVGRLYLSPPAGSTDMWLSDTATNTGNVAGTTDCSQGYRLYCLSAQAFDPAPTNPSVAADPQFVGLQGQQFQVHGMPDEYFNLITTPDFQLNSHFTYLASGQCNYNNTECWTHPGTYVDQLGFMFPGIQIKVVAGPHHKGLRAWVNGEEIVSHGKLHFTASSNSSSVVGVRHSHHDTLVVSCSLFTIEVTNSDWFFNFNVIFHAPEILEAGKVLHYVGDSRRNMGAVDTRYPAYPMHGLVGQTWKNARYPAKRYYQGEVDDYMLVDHTLFSSQFVFNLYQH